MLAYFPHWAAWQPFRAPIVAALVVAAAVFGGRLLRLPRICAAAGGLALAAGWALAAGGVTLVPRFAAGRLPVLAAAALLAGLAADLSGRRWPARLAGFVLAVAAGWWLAGAPLSDGAAAVVLAPMASLALAVLLAQRVLRAPRSPWAAASAALALWGALAAAGAPAPWTGLALVAVAAGLAPLGGPRGAAAMRLPLAAGLAGLAGLVVLVPGRAGRGALSRFDFVAAAPLLATWLLPRLAARMPWGRGVVAAVAAAALAAATCWAAGRVGLR
jgi:hypothetical protein